jgi:hypothetical protein
VLVGDASPEDGSDATGTGGYNDACTGGRSRVAEAHIPGRSRVAEAHIPARSLILKKNGKTAKRKSSHPPMDFFLWPTFSPAMDKKTLHFFRTSNPPRTRREEGRNARLAGVKILNTIPSAKNVSKSKTP